MRDSLASSVGLAMEQKAMPLALVDNVVVIGFPTQIVVDCSQSSASIETDFDSGVGLDYDF